MTVHPAPADHTPTAPVAPSVPAQAAPTPAVVAVVDAPSVVAEVADVDQALTAAAVTAGERIAGLILAAMLDTAGRPDKLPQYLFPDLPPDVVQRIFQAGMTVGYRAGRYASAPRFHRDTLARLQDALAQAGHAAMAGTVARTLTSIAAEPEPDHERTPTGDDDTRGGHW